MRGWPILSASLFVAMVLCIAPEAECAKPPVVRVAVFELAPQNIEKSDLSFKNYLENNILSEILRREGIHVELVPRVHQSYIRDEASFARESRFDFILKGRFTLIDNQFVVSIRLLRNRDGALKEVLPLRESRVPKELASYVLIPCFEFLSSKIANLVQGRPLRQAVLTHCFETYADDTAIQGLAEYLAVELAGELESGKLGSRYQVLGFRKRGEVVQVCKNDLGSYLDLYDFVISGDIRSDRPGHVTIGIKIKNGGKPKLRDSLTRANDSTTLVGEVGQFIVTRWSIVTAK